MTNRKPTKPVAVARRSTKEQDKINKMALPKYITCTTCSMTRPATAYSDAQLRQLRARIYKTGGKILEGQTLAKCEDCTPDPDPERVCKSCGRSKRLREFSKAQRFGGEPLCVQCADWNQQFEHRNDEKELLGGYYDMPALTMEPAKEDTQMAIAHGDQKVPLGESGARDASSGNELVRIAAGQIQQPRLLNEVGSEEGDLEITKYL